MLDFVPLACPWREMADPDGNGEFIGEPLQFQFPQPIPRAVPSSSIRCDRQLPGIGIKSAAHRKPPVPDSRHGKTCGIVIRSHADPRAVAPQVVDTIGIGPAQFLVHKIVDKRRPRAALVAAIPFPRSCTPPPAPSFLCRPKSPVTPRIPGEVCRASDQTARPSFFSVFPFLFFPAFPLLWAYP